MLSVWDKKNILIAGVPKKYARIVTRVEHQDRWSRYFRLLPGKAP
jgi:hypothetical protein